MRWSPVELMKAVKLMNFVKKEKDFIYMEDNSAVFAPKKIIAGKYRIAFKLDIDSSFKLGTIDESCQNFGTLSNGHFCPEEIDWIQEKLEVAKKYWKKVKKK